MVTMETDGDEAWRQIHDKLAEAIRTGEFADGSYLPPQAELMERFATGRHALRRALRALKQDGMIEGGQGARSRVTGSRLQLPVSIRTRFSTAVESMGLPGKAALLSARRRIPNPRIARLLGLSRLVPVPVAVILRSVAERPVSLSYHHFSPTVVCQLPAIPADNPSITQLFRSLGIPDFIRHDTYVSARLPGETEAVELKVRRSEPVLTVIGQNLTPNGEPLEISESVFRADNLDLLFSFPAAMPHNIRRRGQSIS